MRTPSEPGAGAQSPVQQGVSTDERATPACMRIAAVDVGSNSIHLIVARIRPDLTYEVVEREKEMVRLGAGALGGRPLTESAMMAALQTLGRFRRLAGAYGVEEIVAAATSAVREAPNGAEFLAAAGRQTGIRVVALSGAEEARLIHLAALGGLEPVARSVVVDIGGGSTEITLGTATHPDVLASVKLGAIRLTERFVRHDPLTVTDERRIVRYISEELGDLLAPVVAARPYRVVATSGTALAVGALALEQPRSGAPEEELHGRTVSARQLRDTRKRLSALGLEQRLQLPGLNPRRADIIVAGAILFDSLVRRLGMPQVTLSTASLREGLIVDFIRRHADRIVDANREPDLRRRSVRELAERYDYDGPHCRQVARLAVSLFDQTRALHGFGDREREWLEHAALLHDVGHHISPLRHHRHSAYLIRHGGLRGFTAEEVRAIGLIARFHRGPGPKKKGLAPLGEAARRAVRAGAALLRVAEHLDRSHACIVERVELEDRGCEYLVAVFAGGNAELERWACEGQLGPLGELLGKDVRIEITDTSHAEHADHRASVPGQAAGRRRH